MNIAIVDYGRGNLHSLIGALEHAADVNVCVSSDSNVLTKADKLLLPGVGHFASAMCRIREQQLDELLKELVLVKKMPILGVCLGMQIFSKSSAEGVDTLGLGFVDGTVVGFDNSQIRVPHVGFNQVRSKENNRLYRNLPENSDFYFTHSFKMVTSSNIGQAMCDYGSEFVASFEFENIAGVQFHPELSQKNGLQLLKNFVELF